MHVEPNAKSRARLRDKVRTVLDVSTRNEPAVVMIRKVNQLSRGWATVFHLGNCTRCFAKQQVFVRYRLRRWYEAEVRLHPWTLQVLHLRPLAWPVPAVALAEDRGLESTTPLKAIRTNGDSVRRVRETRLHGLTRGRATSWATTI